MVGRTSRWTSRLFPWRVGADPAAFEVVAALSSSPRDEGHLEDGGAPTGVGASSLGWALVLGLLGGLILNLMPCVLPVLAIKVFGIADLARAERSHIVQHGLAYLAGVLASMAALASVVVALRAAGTAVGWGFQLQTPYSSRLSARSSWSLR